MCLSSTLLCAETCETESALNVCANVHVCVILCVHYLCVHLAVLAVVGVGVRGVLGRGGRHHTAVGDRAGALGRLGGQGAAVKPRSWLPCLGFTPHRPWVGAQWADHT